MTQGGVVLVVSQKANLVSSLFCLSVSFVHHRLKEVQEREDLQFYKLWLDVFLIRESVIVVVKSEVEYHLGIIRAPFSLCLWTKEPLVTT